MMKENIMKNRFIKLAIIISFISSTLMLNANVNFSEDISPIIYENCTECHRGGEIGAFLSLTNYDEIFGGRKRGVAAGHKKFKKKYK